MGHAMTTYSKNTKKPVIGFDMGGNVTSFFMGVTLLFLLSAIGTTKHFLCLRLDYL